ncbi:sugar nucleotide-binding protein, partial [Acinetobacter baumannii]
DHTHFMYISTDFIFGENGPHDENETPAPLNFYGESKLMAEQLVKTMKQHYTIVRPVFIYGPSYGNMRPSFLHWVKKN